MIKYIKLYKIAKQIDSYDKTPNRNKVLEMLSKFKPKFLSSGGYKRCFLVKSNKRVLVFKVGRDVETQYKIYQDLKGKHKLKYAKIYWTTKRCLLQRYCKKVDVPKNLIKENKKIAKKLGYSDWRKANIGMFRNEIVVFDLQSAEHKNMKVCNLEVGKN